MISVKQTLLQPLKNKQHAEQNRVQYSLYLLNIEMDHIILTVQPINEVGEFHLKFGLNKNRKKHDDRENSGISPISAPNK